jgi:peptidoglycan/LPS O-acetylase OafA/YrhL
MNRIPVLDGWRGIAIAMVLFDHVQFAAAGGYTHPWLQTGRHGVTIFFVLSSFLITTNLISGPIDLKKFYIRRFFRLMPAAWTFLATLVVVGYLTGTQFTSWPEIKACLLFYRNFAGPVQGDTAGHFWSLSIEEQFYLVWPFLLLLAGARRCRWIAATAAIGVASFRTLMWQHYQGNLLANRTEVRADALLIGCLLALLLSSPSFRDRALMGTKWCAVPAPAALLFAIWKSNLLQPLWKSASIAALLAFTMLHPGTIVSRLLALKPMVWLGTVSYSIYVWQEPFMGFKKTPLALTISVAVALPLFTLGSYYLIERPWTSFGRRITGRPALYGEGSPDCIEAS